MYEVHTDDRYERAKWDAINALAKLEDCIYMEGHHEGETSMDSHYRLLEAIKAYGEASNKVVEFLLIAMTAWRKGNTNMKG